MEYFKLLNLSREPFSNSPDPMFFYKSRGHAECLHQVEIAIRLKRGLNVLIGEVGTGKTTILRRLIQNLSEDKDKIESHLILDPQFPSARAFLIALNRLFGYKKIPKEISEHQLKERLKNYLFRRGVDEGVNVVLIIDEGQKLSREVIEVLRELLNYETNEYKLLQIVIAAQREFLDTLKALPNFRDRANILLQLKPLSLKETRDMVRFRLNLAGREPVASHLFTRGALLAVFRLSRGYPRKIVNLCYNSLLTMIVQNKKRVTASMVRATGGRILEPRRALLRPALLAALLVAVGLFALTNSHIAGYNLDWFAKDESPGPTLSAAAQAPAPKKAVKEEKPGPAEKEVEEEKKAPFPQELGHVVIKKDDFITKLALSIYGSKGRRILDIIKKANPHIEDLNRIRPGEIVNMPLVETVRPGGDYYKLGVAEYRNLDAAYRFVRSRGGDNIRVLPVWDGVGGLRFWVVVKETFRSKEAARRYAENLPGELSGRVNIIGDWDGSIALITLAM